MNRSKELQFTTEALMDLSTYQGVKVSATSNRKKAHFLKQSTVTYSDYKYPSSYDDFLKRQQQMYTEGVKKAQELVKRFLHMELSQPLESNDVWECPYSFQKPANIKMIKSAPLHQNIANEY